jgi:PAS domain S-box-containing protein
MESKTLQTAVERANSGRGEGNAEVNHDALSLAMESAPNGLLMLNASGEIQSVNRAVEKLFGYTREELLGARVEVLLPERLQTPRLEHRDAFNRNKSMQTVAGRDLVGLRKDGAEIPVQVHLNRIETNSGDLILCTVIDIAERVEYEHQLEVAKHAAEAASQAKSDFLARMSHEIRTPMNLIMGMNALLLRSSLSDTQRQHLEIAHRNVKRLLRLINGILDLSKVEAGNFTLEAVPFDLLEDLTECGATMASAMEQKGLQYEMRIEPDVWRYWIGDPERLQQVLLNLIANSVKFTARGKIEVSVRCELGERGEKGLRFEVSDTGSGVPRDKVGMIFEAFQQAEGALDRPSDGTGLGLPIAQSLVGMMGGRIWVEEKPEPGAKFVFTTFFQPSTEAAVRARRAANTSAAVVRPVEAGTRVLLVEDNPENVVLLRAYLEDLPLSLDVASNGAEAVEKFKRGEYELVLMDMQMPVLDGYAATRQIRAWETAKRLPRVPVVALTAHALRGALTDSLDAGCDGHLTKPVEQDDLVDAIARFANRPVARPKPAQNSIAGLRPKFLANRQLDLTKIRTALAAGDFDAIRVIGHNCKGIGTGYGFPEISETGAAIEKAATARDADRLELSLRQFEQCLVHASAEANSPVS